MCPAFCLWARMWLSGWTTLNPNQPILVLLEATLTNVQGESPSYCMKTDLGDTVGWLGSFISAGTWDHRRCRTGQKPGHWVTGDLLDNHQGLSYLRKNVLNALCVCVCLYHCVSASVCSSLCVYLGMCMCLCLYCLVRTLPRFLTAHLAPRISWLPEGICKVDDTAFLVSVIMASQILAASLSNAFKLLLIISYLISSLFSVGTSGWCQLSHNWK